VNWARKHRRWKRQQQDRILFSDESRFLSFIEMMAGLVFTVEKMNVVSTVVLFDEIVLAATVLPWEGKHCAW
jgi:hypothetical protein